AGKEDSATMDTSSCSKMEGLDILLANGRPECGCSSAKVGDGKEGFSDTFCSSVFGVEDKPDESVVCDSMVILCGDLPNSFSAGIVSQYSTPNVASRATAAAAPQYIGCSFFGVGFSTYLERKSSQAPSR